MKTRNELKGNLKKVFMGVILIVAIVTGTLATMKLTGAYTISEGVIIGRENQKVSESEYEITNNSIQTSVTLPSDSLNNNSSLNKMNTLTKMVTDAQIVSGNTFGAVLKTDGTVWTWGNNQYGQLGNGVTQNASTHEVNRVIGVNGEGHLENIKQISAGGYSLLALTSEGKVVSLGMGTAGQLGNNSTSNSNMPVYVQKQVTKTDSAGNDFVDYVDLDNIVQISCGSSHMLALDSNGTVWSWGQNNYGQLGVNATGNIKYAVKVQKEIEQTLEDGVSQIVLVDLNEIKQVSAGVDYSTALTKTGEVYAWGLGTTGQIGNGASKTVYVPNKVSNLTDVKQISAGGMQVIALKTDGTVWAWGQNNYGNLGINATTPASKNIPVQVLVAANTPLENVQKISSIYQTSFALTNEGKVYGWGLNTSGQIGDYTTANKTVATIVRTVGKVELEKIKILTEGQNTHVNYMIDENGYVFGSGVSSSKQMMSERTSVTYFAKNLGEAYLELSNNQSYLEVGNSLSLNVRYNNGFNVSYREIEMGEIEYRSSNENIAKVDATGKVTAVNRGYVTIIAEDKTNGYIAQSIINVISKDAIAIPKVISGTTFTAYLKEDGTVWTSGAATNGVLGNGSNINVNKPTQVKVNANEYLTGIRKIEVGTEHVIALKEDGTVWTWGLNSSGQLGNGTTNNSKYAIQVLDEAGEDYLKNIIDVEAGLDYSLALSNEKNVYAWGAGANHALGVNNTGNKSIPVQMHDSYNVIQMQGGSDTTLVLKSDGTVWGTGYNNVGQLADSTASTRANLVPALNNELNNVLKGIVRIASGIHHTIALKEDGTAWCWGYNNYGQLGINSTTNYKYPIDLRNLGNTDVMTDILSIGTGPSSTFVQDKNGNVYAVGLNTKGELSIGTSTNAKVFNIVKDENGNDISDILSLENSTGTTYCFAFSNGTVGITGLGTSGQHGNLTNANSNKITKIQNASLITGDLYEIKVNETAKINVEINQGFNLNINNQVKIELGNLTYESLDENIAVVTGDGSIRGINKGKTGVKVIDEKNGLETIAQVVVGERELNDISKIVSGGSHAVLLKEDGTVWTWGQNNYGQLGIGDISGKEVEEARQVLGVNGEGYLTDVIDIAAGGNFTVALMRNGKVVTWGQNDYGQLGDTSDATPAPIYVKDANNNILTGIVDISGSRDHAVALKADGTVWCWGRNDYAQLGNNTTVNSCYAVQVLSSDGKDYLKGIKSVKCGGAFVVALTEEGELYSWGYNAYGQTGNGNKTSPQKLPVKAKNVTDVKKIATGHYHVMALKTDGTLWTWGLNRYGQLGYGLSSTSSSNGNYAKTTAVQVKIDSTTFLEDVVDIGSNIETSYAVTSDGIAYGWGLNTTGQIGDYTVSNKAYATRVVRNYGSELESSIKKVISDSANGSTSFMIKTDGTILANGKVENGQLLDGGLDTAARNYADDVLASYLEITEKNVYVKIGETKALNVQMIENLNAFAKAPEYGKLTWKSTNPNVATVDSDGNVTALKLGETTIIVTEDKYNYKAQATIYVTSDNVNAVAAPMIVQGTNFTVVLKADGTVWTTGLNTYGQLGDGTKDYRSEFEKVKIDENTYLTNVLRISAGEGHVLAVTKAGEVYSWGFGTAGQLGAGDTQNRSYAQKVLDETGENYLENIIDIAAGGRHSIALKRNGDVYAWGKGGNYQLGNNKTANMTLPIKIVEAYNIVKISAGTEYTILLRGDGKVFGTGLNTNGWLGTANTTTRTTLIELGNVTDKIITDIYNIKARWQSCSIIK